MYVVINRKPENGCEIQNAACGHSGVMIRLKVVKTAEEENASVVTDDDGNNHGTNVLKFLVEPWVRMDGCVCANSYFVSVNAVTVMRMMGCISLEWSRWPPKNSHCPTCPTWSWCSMGTTWDWWPGEPMGNQQCCHLYGRIGTAIISLPVHHRKCLWSWMHCLRTWNSPSHSPRRWKLLLDMRCY